MRDRTVNHVDKAEDEELMRWQGRFAKAVKWIDNK